MSTAIAHPNIALAKYWGKRAGPGNFPAVPSLSVTLAGMSTRTSVTFDEGLEQDFVALNGAEGAGDVRARVVALLDRVRERSGERRRARVESTNDFPTASGLASSASGFAALALAATHAAGGDVDGVDAVTLVSDLARRSSASAARSLFGGYVELAAGPEAPAPDAQNDIEPTEMLAARTVAPADHLDLRVIVCVASEGAKSIGSTEAMRRTAAESPYYGAWLDAAPRIFDRMREALLARDFGEVGALAESSALAMHASAMAAGIVYFGPATLGVLHAVRTLRASGIHAFVTMDAGPHAKVLVSAHDVARVTDVMRAVPGVLRTIEARPGEGARIA